MSACIVVGGLDYGEADRILRFLTADQGRVSAMARRLRASKRRFAGVLELGNKVEIEWGKGRGSLASVKGVDLLSAPRLARTDLQRLAFLSWGCELCASLAPEGGRAEKLYGLLEVWLELLEREGPPPGVASRLALEAKALTFAGLTPALTRDARTGWPLRDAAAGFDAEAGGAILWAGRGVKVKRQWLEVLERLRHTPLAETRDLGAPDRRAHWLLADFAEHHLGRALKSRSMLTVMDRNPMHDTG